MGQEFNALQENGSFCMDENGESESEKRDGSASRNRFNSHMTRSDAQPCIDAKFSYHWTYNVDVTRSIEIYDSFDVWWRLPTHNMHAKNK